MYMKSIYRIAGVFMLLAAMVGCEDLQEVEPTVTLNQELISNLKVGEERTLVPEIKPEGIEVVIEWSSDNEDIASVDDKGVVRGVAPGETMITAKVGEVSASCKVVVIAVKPSAIELDETEIELGDTPAYQLQVILTPSDAVADELQWSTSDADVATVKDGLVTAVSKGEAVITVKCSGDGGNILSATCMVTVTHVGERVSVTAIELESELSLAAGSSRNLVWSVLPENATDKTVSFTVKEGSEIVSVNENGRITALKEGEAVITAAANDGSGVTADCSVTVTKDLSVKVVIIPTPEEAVMFKDNIFDIQVGKKIQLTAEYAPEDAAPVSSSWTIVEGSEYARISQTGELEGLSTYYDEDMREWATVRVRHTVDGVSGDRVVRVIPPQPDGILLDIPQRTLKVGESWNANPRVSPENAGLPFTCYHETSRVMGDVTFRSEQPGHFAILFGISDHPDLVYLDRRNVFVADVEPYWVESVSLQSELSLEVGRSTTLIPEFTSDVDGHQPTYKELVWSSSDGNVVKVDDKGNVTAVGKGTATITAMTSKDAVPSGEEPKSATCEVTVTEALNPASVGDYFYSDGTWSSELQSGKTVIGVVFATTDATSTDPYLKMDYPDCTRGLVIGTSQYNTSFASDREWSVTDMSNWMSSNGYTQLQDYDRCCGYGNTKGFFAVNEAGVTSYGDVIRIDVCNPVTQYKDAVSLPQGVSDPFIPSFREMQMLYENIDKINVSLENAGGTVINRIYTISFKYSNGQQMTADKDQQYYYSNVESSGIKSFNMNAGNAVSPSLYVDGDNFAPASTGEKTELPVRIIYAF